MTHRRHFFRSLLGVLGLGCAAPANTILPPFPNGKSKLPQSFDARDWAKEFVQHVLAKPSIATDEETMLTWFANAIMAGYDEYARKFESQPLTPESMRTELRGAVARGWCHAKNSHKAMDADLAAAIVDELMQLQGVFIAQFERDGCIPV